MNVDYLEISGGKPLRGEICVQGSKNAVLPILSACLLGEGVCEIENCPLIRDVEDTLEIMRTLGCTIQRNGHTVIVDASGTDTYEIKTKEAARIRSSVLFLGALLGKMKKAVIPRPGRLRDRKTSGRSPFKRIGGARCRNIRWRNDQGIHLRAKGQHIYTSLSKCRRYRKCSAGSSCGSGADSDPKCRQRAGD